MTNIDTNSGEVTSFYTNNKATPDHMTRPKNKSLPLKLLLTPLIHPFPLHYPLFLFPLTRSTVWLKLQGADLSSVGFSTVHAVSAWLWKKKKKPTHGGNYGIMLRQECSHDGQWDLMEVPVAA